jgi:hypothetical protein
MLPPDDVRGILSRLRAGADRADEALPGDGIAPLELATAAVEAGRLADKLGKPADRLQGDGKK